MLVRIASRSSFLAKWQAYQVGREIFKQNPECKIEYQFRESLGDKNLTDPLWKMPDKGVFTEDFYSDLVENRSDLIVHSWKDLPTEEKEKTFIAATLNRADQRDLLLFKKTSLGKNNLNIFTSSPRRVHHVSETLTWSLPFKINRIDFTNVRGNIQTRINKLLQDDQVDGLILAKAALDRLMDSSFYQEPDFLELRTLLSGQLQNFNFQILPLSENPTAAAQGALAIEILRSREDLIVLLNKINKTQDFSNCNYERKKLTEFGGGCHQKIGLSLLTVNSQPVFFASGVKENNELIHYKGRIEGRQLRFSDSEIMTSTELWSRVKRQNTSAHQNFTGKAVLITKKETLQSVTLSNCCIITAGIETWKHLAKIGVWVQGSTDSLGESQLPVLSGWVSEILKIEDHSWYKLTHQNSPPTDSANSIKNIATYSLKYEPHPGLNIKNIKMIYWKSGFEFLRALEIWPELKKIEHACGMGQSAKTIGSQADSSKVTLYYNEQDWRKSVLQTF